MKIQRALTIAIIFMMSLTTISSIAVSFNTTDVKQELDLLHGETFLNITSPVTLDSPFDISYVAPLNYMNQAPILFTMREDTTSNIISYTIEGDINLPNKVITLAIAPLTEGEIVTIHFDYWVLVKNNDYADLPTYVKLPKEDDLPKESKPWLASSKSVQSDHPLIRLKATQLKGVSNNLVRLANRIVLSTTNYLNRRVIRKLGIRDFLWDSTRKITGNSGWLPLQDAVSSFLIGGSCYARSHLGVALFRANGVPARSIIITPTYNQEMEQHVICEYYCPGYGWVPAETNLMCTPPRDIVENIFLSIANKRGFHNLPIPYETKSYVVLRINYPDDEEVAGNGLSFYGGMEPYMITNPKELCSILEGVEPRTHGWIEKELTTNQNNANLALSLTKDVYELHTRYLGLELTGDDLLHFNNAIMAQQNAIECFKKSDVTGYIENMIIAYDEYMNIN